MAQARRVTLLSTDLMFSSQLGEAMRRTGTELTISRRTEVPTGDFDAVFVDLNAEVGHRLGVIALLREARPELEIVAFCHHGEKETRTMAMNVGASSCVTNGALQSVAVRLAGVQPRPGRGRG